MNPPQVYMCSPSWTLPPPPSPFHPSGSSQCTSPKHPVSCIEPNNSLWILKGEQQAGEVVRRHLCSRILSTFILSSFPDNLKNSWSCFWLPPTWESDSALAGRVTKDLRYYLRNTGVMRSPVRLSCWLRLEIFVCRCRSSCYTDVPSFATLP